MADMGAAKAGCEVAVIGLRQATDTETAPAFVVWTGRSGKRYPLLRESEASAALTPGRLYALEAGEAIRWAGTAEDLIADAASRTKFRRLMAAGARLLSLVAPADPLAVMTLVWDLEGSHESASQRAA